jgi:hypothetical protein
MMNTKIIQNQKDITTGIFCQSGHKLDQKFGIHCIPVHHESHLPAVGDGRYHTDMAPFCHHPDYRGLSLRGKTSNSIGARLNPSLITPVNLGFFLFRPRENDRIMLLHPFLYRLRTLLLSALLRRARNWSPHSDRNTPWCWTSLEHWAQRDRRSRQGIRRKYFVGLFCWFGR